MPTNKEKQQELMFAIVDGEVERAFQLMDEGAELLLRDEFDRSPFTRMLAEICDFGYAYGDVEWDEDFEPYVRRAAAPEIRDNDGAHALHLVVRAQLPEAVEILLDAGAPADVETKDGITPLEIAKAIGNEEIVEMLSVYPQRPPRDLSVLPDLEWDLLQAARNMDIPRLKKALAAGANPNGDVWNICIYWMVRDTPLHLIMYAHKPDDETAEAAQALLQAGGNPNRIQDAEDETPLHYAATWSKAKTVKALLDAGAVTDEEDIRHMTPLDIVCGRKGPQDLECAKLLLAAGAEVNHINEYGATPLDCALKYGPEELAALILARGGKTAKELKSK